MTAQEQQPTPEDIPSFRWIVAGCTGSGKTWLVKWLLRELPEGELDEVIVITATGAAKDWPETTPNRIYSDWDPQRVRRQMHRPGHKLFIIDDFLGLIRPDEPALVHLFTAGRHRGASVILITQRMNGFAPAIRVNASRIYLCRTLAAKELDILYDETATSALRKRSDWYAFVEEATRRRGVLVIQMVCDGKDGSPFSVVRPPGVLHDLFVEPNYDTDPEDERQPDERPRRVARPKRRLTKRLPASNRRWRFRNAETRPKAAPKARPPARAPAKKRIGRAPRAR